MIKTVGVRTEKRNKYCFILMQQAQTSLKYVCKIFYEERVTWGIRRKHLLFHSKYPTKFPVEEVYLTYQSLSVYLLLPPRPGVSVLVAQNQAFYLYHRNWPMYISVFFSSWRAVKQRLAYFCPPIAILGRQEDTHIQTLPLL